MSNDRLSTAVENDGAGAVVTVSGELDLATVDTLKAAFENTLADAPGRIVVDLAGVSFVDSTGLGAFVDYHHQCSDAEVSLSFRAVPDQVNRLIEITRLNELLVLE